MDVVKVVSVPDAMTVYERAANRAFRDVVYSMAPRFPPDVVHVLTEWHRSNGGIIPWLRALGDEASLAEAAILTMADKAATVAPCQHEENGNEQ